MATAISFKKAPTAATAAATSAATAATSPTPTAATTVVASVPTAAKTVAATTAATPPVAETPTSAVAETGGAQEIVPADFYNGIGGFEGEFAASEMRTPYLSLVQKTSPLFDEMPTALGQFVYNKAIVLGDSIRIVFVRATKWWVEDLPYGTEQIPQRFKRMEDARTAGFTPNQLVEVAELDLLIELDATLEGIDEVADLIEGTKAYLIARYSVRSSSYGRTVPTLMADMRGFLKGNFVNGFYTLSAEKIEGKKGTYYVPKLKTDGPTSQELRTAIVNRCAPSAV